MFNKDFYPTPKEVINLMLEDYNLTDKIVLEPSAGKGDIVDYCKEQGANVIACEINKDLSKILATKCNIISDDFLNVEAENISHVDYIVMNPPFSADEKHINHAWDIAPDGCKIIALCNSKTLFNDYSMSRRQLLATIENYGFITDLGECFSNSERKTDVNVSMVVLDKPKENNENEFEGFFLDEEPEEANQSEGIMPYNFIRDIVNRYIQAVKLFDKQLDLGVEMNSLIGGYYSKLAFKIETEKKQLTKAEFKKDLQRAFWKNIFRRMEMDKYMTQGLKSDMNKFIENQTEIPFTMKNIYKMLEIIIGTTSSRMDKALIEVFDKITKHYDENRYFVEGWKTNDYYLVNKKFILPCVADRDFRDDMRISGYGSQYINDFTKALCYMNGLNFDDIGDLNDLDRFKLQFGKWFDWGFFECKGFKKGSMHFKFKDDNVWAKFNQEVARLKGYPLFEGKKAS